MQKFMTMTNHGYIGYVVVVNKKFWEGLPPGYSHPVRKGHEGSHRFRQRAIGQGKR